MVKTTPELISLSGLFPCWKGRVIPIAYEALVRGINTERNRLGAKRFLTTKWLYWWDYDCVFEAIDLLHSYDSLKEARHFLDQFAEGYISEQMNRKGEGDEWTLEQSHSGSAAASLPPSHGHPPDPPTGARITREYYRFFKNTDGIEAISLFLQVLRMPEGEIVCDELMAYLNCEAELTSYLRM